MSGFRPKCLPRRATLLALSWLLLAAQQLALLHPLSHLDGTTLARLDVHGETPAPEAAEPGCSLCPASAAAMHLAAATHSATAAPRGNAPTVAAAGASGLPDRAAAQPHNRGPPAAA